MRSKLLSACLLLIAINVCAFGQPSLSKARAPEPANISGYVRAACVPLPVGIRICKCVSDAEDDFVAEKGGVIASKWPARAFLGETSDFEVLTGDLDGNGSKEVIVANHDMTSNGIGINYWTISIFPGASVQDFERPLMFSVEEYGSFGTFVRARRAVNILATRWLWTKALSGRRGTGLYLTGRMWRYQQGRLLPVAKRPLMARRFLNSFAEERGQTSERSDVPYRWLNNPQAEARRIDPLIAFKEKESLEGIISDVTLSEKKDRITISIAFARTSGQSPSRISYAYPVEPDEQVKNAFSHIGETSTNVIYPENYLPAQPVKWLKGRRCKLVTYDGQYQSENLRALWLL